MSGGRLEEVQAAAQNLIRRIDLDHQDLAIINFASQAQLVAEFNSQDEQMLEAIANLRASGGTHFIAAFNLGESLLQQSDLPPNLLLFTDGVPNHPQGAARRAESLRNQDINLFAIATGNANISYLEEITGDRDRIFYADSGNIENAFIAAEQLIYQQQLVESELSGDYGLLFGLLRIGVWTGFLALGTALALIIGQNANLRRRLLSPLEALYGGGGGFLAGLTAGALGQLAFLPTSSVPHLSWLARLSGWTVLGILVGGGMSGFVPNLPWRNALLAGLLGGLLGAGGFLLLDVLVSVILARLVGAWILGFCIGLAIALTETLLRQATISIQWTPNESTTLTLGQEPIYLGSSRQAHIYLPKDKGFPPQFASVFLENDQIILEFHPSIQEQEKYKTMKNLKQVLADGSRRKFDDILLEVHHK
jgi:Ca-activated chloride channel family protein